MSTAVQNQAENELQSVAGGHPVLFFDGVCGLCSHAVDFVMARDTQATFRFAPLQGETARAMLPEADIVNLDSMAVAINGSIYRRSSAVVRILWQLGPLWRFCGWALWLIPLPLRDLGYKLVAKWRYRLFGKHETCRLPTPEERERFLD
ncbi:MAG: DUF393 domain-containing protein [Planctomycetaceae bacterium]|nr:DUF393 domain-containing protein [Planctomycetaceae bacterium]